MKKRILSLMLSVIMLMALYVPMEVSAAPDVQKQYTAYWKTVNYVDGSACSGNAYTCTCVYHTACGMFSFINAVNYLTGNLLSMDEVAPWAVSNGYYDENGTYRTFYQAAASKWGSTYGFKMDGTNSGGWSNTTIKNHLANGGVVVGHVPSHYIAIVDYDTSTGEYLIYDSAPSSNRGTQSGVGVWMTESEIATYNGAHGLVPFDWAALLSKTVTTSPSENLGDSFMASISNTNGSTVHLSTNDTKTQVKAYSGDIYYPEVWQFTRQSDGTYEIKSVKNGYCLDVSDAGVDKGTTVGVWGDNDSNAQRWYVYAVTGGYKLVPKHATNMALDCSTNAKAMQIWQDNEGSATQVFAINELTYAPSDNIGDSFDSSITNTNGTTVNFATNDEKTQVRGYEGDMSLSTTWQFVRQTDGSYEITSAKNGYCLDVSDAGVDNGTVVDVWGDNDTAAQRWFVYEVSGGYKLVPKHATNMALDCATNAKTAQIWSDNEGSATQVFTLNKVDIPPSEALGDSFMASISNTNGTTVYLSTNDTKTQVKSYDGNVFYPKIWQFTRQSDGSYEIKCTKFGYALEVAGSATEKGTVVQVNDNTEEDNQSWFIYAVTGGYKLVPKCAEGMALDCATNAKTMQIWTDNEGSATQVFAINKTTVVPSDNIGDSFYATLSNTSVVNTSEGETVYFTTNDGTTNVPGLAADNSRSQVWEFTLQTDGTYEIKSTSNGLVFDAVNTAPVQDDFVYVRADTDADTQRWYIYEVSGGYRIVPKNATGLTLQTTTSGKRLHLWGYHEGRASQIYAIDKVETLPDETPEPTLYTATISASSNGTATFDGNNSTVEVNPNTTVYYTVTPNQGYRVASITVDGALVTVENDGGAYTYGVTLTDASTLIKVIFEKDIAISETGTASVNKDGVVSVGGVSVNSSEQVTVMVVTKTAYESENITAADICYFDQFPASEMEAKLSNLIARDLTHGDYYVLVGGTNMSAEVIPMGTITVGDVSADGAKLTWTVTVKANLMLEDTVKAKLYNTSTNQESEGAILYWDDGVITGEGDVTFDVVTNLKDAQYSNSTELEISSGVVSNRN
ncbi:MAG: RICIN domain-containing protein [Clostridia bacterium]|nr:RICIN domain-containing protein [Clostridia bacterium]